MEYVFSDRLKNLQGNAIREIFKLLANPEVISFAGGMPALKCLPQAQIAKFSNELLTGDKATTMLQYGSTEGYLPLREQVVNYVKEVGIENISIDNTLILSGGQQGIDLTFKAFLNKGDNILVEDPTYLACLHILKTYEGNAYGIKSDADGINLNDLEAKIKKYSPKILYLVPNFSNPTGKTLSIEKRKAILELCVKNNVIILEDDPYGKLRFDGEDVNSIKSLDTYGNVIYISSFSKTVSPGLRVGFAVADTKIIRKLTIGKQAVDVHTPTLNQAIVTEFIKDDTLKKHIATTLPVYKDKKDCMLACIEKYMPEEFKFTRPQGGLFIFGEFDKKTGISTVECFKEAIERKVAYVDGTSFFADGSGENTMRLNFSNASNENIEIGIKKLAELFKSKIK